MFSSVNMSSLTGHFIRYNYSIVFLMLVDVVKTS